MQTWRVADFLIHGCAQLGVRHIFGVDGANIEDLYDAIVDQSVVAGIVAKHEFSAATMADGYSRSIGIGVVAATSGGGAMNLISGLAESFTSRIPILALVGQPPTTAEGNGAFQDSSGRAGAIDAVRLFGEVSRFCARVERGEELPDLFARAVAAARDGGPAVLLLPKDVQQSRIARSAAPCTMSPSSTPDPLGLAAVRAELTAARTVGTVAVVAGDQVARDDARAQLRDLVTAIDAVVAVTPDAKDVYSAQDPGFCGVAGVMGHPEPVAALREAALCLLIGTRLPMMATVATIGGRIASVGAERPYRPSTHAYSRDLRHTLWELSTAMGEPAALPSSPRRMIGRLRPPPAHGPGLRYRDAVTAIAAALPEGCIVVADAGNTGAAVVHHLDLPRDARFVVALGMGGMGYSFGAVIGAAFATGRPGFLIAGDGAFFMHGMEIHTAIEHRLPITFIVFNNNAHAMCAIREQLFYRDRYSFNRFQPAFLAEGLAAMLPTLPSYPARTVDELIDALSRPTDGPRFICVDCDPDEVPPFVPFLPQH